MVSKRRTNQVAIVIRRTCFFSICLVLTGCGQPSDRNAADPERDYEQDTFVGSPACAGCHETEHDLWRGSHHDLAMQEATAQSVLGNFNDEEFSNYGLTSRFFRRGDEFWVKTDNASGGIEDFQISYTFGVDPLQQYLIELSGGRLQALSIAWDSRSTEEGGQRWFHLYPDEAIRHDDPLHWTGPGQNWNYMCAECHSTDLQKNYSATDNTYATTWSEIDVACESCHGPGSAHIAWAENGSPGSNSGLVLSLDDHGSARWQMNQNTGIAELSELPMRIQRQPEACGRCHSRRGIITTDYEYGQPLMDTHMPALLEPGLYYADGQVLAEVYVYGSFLQSKMYRAGVTCSDCHDPHSQELKTDGVVSNVCSQCHAPTKFARTEHHFHEPNTVECVDCHMPSSNYMVIDARRDHSFRIPRPGLSVATAAPNACTNCHSEQTDAWAVTAIDNWYGKSPGSEPHYALALHAGRNQAEGQRELVGKLLDASNEPGIVRATALGLMAQPFTTQDIERLRQSLQSGDPLLRVSALRMLVALPPDARVALAAPLLDDSVRGVRITAASVLAVVRDYLPSTSMAAFRSAATEYKAAQQSVAERPESHTNLGNFLRDLGDLDAAEQAFAQALIKQPHWVAARINLADLHRLRGDNAKSIDELEQGLALDPDDASIHHALGLAMIRGGDTDSALTYLAKAAEAAPDNIRNIYVYAIGLHSLGQTQKALELLQSIHGRHPADFEIAWALATINRDIGEVERARKYARLLMAEHPDDEGVRQLLQSLGN